MNKDKLSITAQKPNAGVGAIIDRPAEKNYEFASGFGEYESMHRTGDQ